MSSSSGLAESNINSYELPVILPSLPLTTNVSTAMTSGMPTSSSAYQLVMPLPSLSTMGLPMGADRSSTLSAPLFPTFDVSSYATSTVPQWMTTRPTAHAMPHRMAAPDASNTVNVNGTHITFHPTYLSAPIAPENSSSLASFHSLPSTVSSASSSAASSLTAESFIANLSTLTINTPRLLCLPVDSITDTPVFVSTRQYNSIIKRRAIRAKANWPRQKKKHVSRQLHAARRARGVGGRFLTKAERDKLKAQSMIRQASIDSVTKRQAQSAQVIR